MIAAFGVLADDIELVNVVSRVATASFSYETLDKELARRLRFMRETKWRGFRSRQKRPGGREPTPSAWQWRFDWRQARHDGDTKWSHSRLPTSLKRCLHQTSTRSRACSWCSSTP